MQNNKGEETHVGRWIGYGVLGLVVIVLLFGTFGTVSAGNVGVRTSFGKVTGEVQPGLFVKLPFIDLSPSK